MSGRLDRAAVGTFLAELDKLAEPHAKALRMIHEMQGLVIEQSGHGEVIGHCESCGVVLFDDDQTLTAPDDGIIGCVPSMTYRRAGGRCYDPEREDPAP